jgi:hypothetical protein
MDDLLFILRRLDTKEIEDYMYEIVYEAFDFWSACDYNTQDLYLKVIIDSSAETFLLNYIYEKKYEKYFPELKDIVSKKMVLLYSEMIKEYYISEKEYENC